NGGSTSSCVAEPTATERSRTRAPSSSSELAPTTLARRASSPTTCCTTYSTVCSGVTSTVRDGVPAASAATAKNRISMSASNCAHVAVGLLEGRLPDPVPGTLLELAPEPEPCDLLVAGAGAQ